MKTKDLFIFFFIALIYAGCTSGKKSLEKGNYYQSTIQSIERLRKNPNHRKSKDVLRQSYPLAVQYYTDRVNNLKRSSDPFKNGLIISEYERLNSLYEQIRRSPGALAVVPQPKKFYDEVRLLTDAAAEERYSAGMQALQRNNREYAKEAYQHFVLADGYVPGYKDVKDRMEEALDMATLKVMVEQIPVPTVQYQLSVEFFQDQVDEFLFHYQGNEFVRFFSPNDSWLKNPDQIMVIMFDDFTVGNVNNFESTKEVSRDSVIVGSVTLDDGTKKDVYSTVKAKYTENRREIISRGLVSMKILDGGTKRLIVHEKFPGEFVWVSRWANFNGDERALEKEQIEATKSKPRNPPPQQDLFVEFTKPIYSQLTSTIQNYYRNY